MSSAGAATTPPEGAAAKRKKPGSGAVGYGVAAPARKRDRKKKNPKLIPSKVEHVIPESAYFTQLVELERRMDQVLARKKADIEAILNNPETLKQVLRLYVYSKHENQGSTDPEEPPCWTLVIHGRLLSPDKEDLQQQQQPPGAPIPKAKTLAGLLRSLEITLDPEQFEGDRGKILWSAETHTGVLSEAFEIKRSGDRPCKANIKLGLNSVPEKYRLSDLLAEVVGRKQETRQKVMRGVWGYIKHHGLQRADNPMVIDCDDKLQSLFSTPKMMLPNIGQHLAAHMSKAPPIEIEYTIQTEGPSPTHPDCYDIQVDVPASHSPVLTDFLQKLNKDRELELYDGRISAGIEKINEHRRRRAFLLGLSQSPVDFLNSLVASQAKDLRAAQAVPGQGAAYEGLRRTELFQGKWVEDAVYRYLQKKGQ